MSSCEVVPPAGDDASKNPVRLGLCELLTHSKKYSGAYVTVSTRITSSKEGAAIRDPACRSLAAVLRFDPQADVDAKIADLLNMLRLHGLSDHPVTATLTGVLREERVEHSILRTKLVFNAREASDIKQTERIERW